ncbi:S8 family serine peptidase [Dokdonella sp.]|uniref:S8 family serine peptidase n=1 Tax=Dokdonella sp. TaxID=2291710 RepID=UPI001B0A56DB|nr:S8 family serine peptidase [Dokdonella sp.]MBO9663083.1 S8 family serine peptidase [Dokdonella sp.]
MPSPSLPRTALAAALMLAFGQAIASEHVPASPPALDAVEAARGDSTQLILRSGIFDPTQQSLNVSAVGAAPDAPTRYAIVQFQPGKTAAHKALAARGIEVLGYVPNHAYFVRLGREGLPALTSDPAVRWAGPLRPAMKLDPNLWTAARTNSAALQNDGRYEILVEAFRGVSAAQIEATLRREVPDVEIPMRSQRSEATPYVRARVPAAALDALLTSATAIDGVAFVSPWHPLRTSNAASIGAIQGNMTDDCAGSGRLCGTSPMFGHGLTGSGQIVGIADSGTTPNAAWFTSLDKGDGPHTEVTFADNPPPLPPALGTLHPDNKIVAYWTQPGGPIDYDYFSGHGTHTSGTLVGDAAGTFGADSFLPSTPWLPNHDLADGMAPNAQLLMQDIGGDNPIELIVQDFEGTLQQAHGGGVRIHSDSWGGSTSGQYSAVDANVDRMTHRLEDLLVVIAAGNNQTGAMAVGSPGNSKNGVTVAALGHGGSLVKSSLSNAGPTADGRLKPDLAAPGTETISAAAVGEVTAQVTAPQTVPNTGTSMATPVVAGNAVLLRQYFVDGFYPRGFANTAAAADRVFADGFDGVAPPPLTGGEAVDAFNPTGAMLKAVLLNGTVPTTTPAAFPNTGTGWGRPWLDGNVWFKQTLPGGDDSRRLRVFERSNAAGLVTGEADEYAIAEVAAGIEFRATLTWFDPAASTGTAAALVNNLDLEVVAPNGTVYRGNRFSNGVSVPGGSGDRKDTVEQVRFTAPLAGAYTIRVKATDVPGNGEADTDRQGYAVAVSGAFGLPDAPAFPAPTALSIAANSSDGVSVDANAAGDAQGFQLYRADGHCATAARGDFHLVANGPALPLADTHSEGGFAYAYRLRGVRNDVEGELSECVDVVSQDDCGLTPDFNRASVTASGAHATCSVDLSWSAATSSCPTQTTMTYQVERDTDPYFGNPQTVAAALSTPEYVDTAVANGTSYYYRVTAHDAAGNPSLTSYPIVVTPTGPDGPDPSDYLDDVDTRSHAVLQTPWRVTDTAAAAGTYSYLTGADGAPYPDQTCGSLSTPPLTLTADAVLSLQARYDLEYQWDGVAQEISTDGGVSWTDLPPDGGYPSSFARTGAAPINACGYSAAQGAFSGVSTASSNSDPGNGTATAVFKPFTTSLQSYAGQTVQIRWRFSSDQNTGFDGFFLDQIRITGTPGSGDYQCH